MVRRIFNSICMFGPAVAFIILSFHPESVRCDMVYVAFWLCLGMFMNGALSSGHFAAPGDLAPNFSGTVFGLSNTISAVTVSVIAPQFIGEVTNDNMTFDAWTIIFATTSVFYIIPNIAYLFLIKGDVQPWNDDQKDSKAEVEEELNFMN